MHGKRIIKWCVRISQVPNTSTKALSDNCRPVDRDCGERHENHCHIDIPLSISCLNAAWPKADAEIPYTSWHRLDLCHRGFPIPAPPSLLSSLLLFLPSSPYLLFTHQTSFDLWVLDTSPIRRCQESYANFKFRKVWKMLTSRDEVGFFQTLS